MIKIFNKQVAVNMPKFYRVLKLKKDLVWKKCSTKPKTFFLSQVNVLESALSTHERVASAEIRPLHDHLAERFSKGMKASLLNQHHLLKLTTNLSSPGTPHHNNNKAGPTGSAQRKSKIVNTPLPPLPPQQHPHHQGTTQTALN